MSEVENYNGSKYESMYDFSGGFSQGFLGALGGDFKIAKNVNIFSEISFIAQSWAPQKRTLTGYKVDGVDYLSSVPKYYKEVEFVESYTPSGTINNNETQKSLIQYFPFSSIGINIGIKIKI